MPNRLDFTLGVKNFRIPLILLSLYVVLFISTPMLAVDEVNSSATSSVLDTLEKEEKMAGDKVNSSVTSVSRTLRSLWSIIVIVLCVTLRKKEIGGWLLYYYFQLYSGVVFSVVLIMISFQNYLPMTWGGITGLYLLFLMSTIPSLLVLFVELIFAERLRKSRNFEHLCPFRIVLWLDFGIAFLGLLIDLIVFQENVPLAMIGLISPTIWLPYFYYSKRVDRVFRTHNWIVIENNK